MIVWLLHWNLDFFTAGRLDGHLYLLRAFTTLNRQICIAFLFIFLFLFVLVFAGTDFLLLKCLTSVATGCFHAWFFLVFAGAHDYFTIIVSIARLSISTR